MLEKPCSSHEVSSLGFEKISNWSRTWVVVWWLWKWCCFRTFYGNGYVINGFVLKNKKIWFCVFMRFEKQSLRVVICVLKILCLLSTMILGTKWIILWFWNGKFLELVLLVLFGRGMHVCVAMGFQIFMRPKWEGDDHWFGEWSWF